MSRGSERLVGDDSPYLQARRRNFAIGDRFASLGTETPMKLVAISMVKNEADMIEAFVRHTRAWVDHHLVFDHDSTDGTREILAALVREGLPLSLFTDDALAKLQHARTNHLARLAFADHQADWVLPLDADEILVAASRAALEQALAAGPDRDPVTLPLRNYVPTPADDPREPNPVLRLRHRRPAASTTGKVFLPRHLGLDPAVTLGTGSHALYRGNEPIASRGLPHAWLAHFPLRSPAQQALRVLTAELQKLARGRAAEGIDVHYRLGFQLLAEDPERFFATVQQPAASLTLDPAPYLGGPLRHSLALTDLARTARALVPFLEKLAASHGRLVDEAPATSTDTAASIIRPLDAAKILPLPQSRGAAFSGFTPVSGWAAPEGPVPEAFLPPFHWALGPETRLIISAATAKTGRLEAEVMTYAERQTTTVLLNGVELFRHAFPRVNQKETLSATLPLRAGENQLTFRHTAWLESPADPRKLALIFLSLRVTGCRRGACRAVAGEGGPSPRLGRKRGEGTPPTSDSNPRRRFLAADLFSVSSKLLGGLGEMLGFDAVRHGIFDTEFTEEARRTGRNPVGPSQRGRPLSGWA